jgi:hypothetical protein
MAHKLELVEEGKELRISFTTRTNKQVTLMVSGQVMKEAIKEWFKEEKQDKMT